MSSDQIIIQAMSDVVADIGTVVAFSRLFASPAFPAGIGPDFINACAIVRTGLDAGAVLVALHRIEARYGRQRDRRWGARTLDLDLVAIEGEMHPDAQTLGRWMDLAPDRQSSEAPAQLILPHPRLQDRAFVLIPLSEIAPDWRHPITGRTVSEMIAGLSSADKAGILPV
ncbi:MAG: 2-amino-4-hydroxy-6-hydroxymethyldihydropteridine diphosphokinase [Rhodobacteraceae bacterium]|nr:2-amino-4-hydroxy-6-hydroxymethyldihydropteridine diphosphokinase [Paracoccaceae bacterium]